LQDQNELYRQLVAQLELMEASAKTPAIQELEQRLNEEPENTELMFELAIQFSQDGHNRKALSLLYELLQGDLNFSAGKARTMFLDILATLGKGHPLAVEFQRKFYTLLY
jgi:putative thioredoxin